MTDTLGVRDLAAGLAQLMLHPETEPLTLGIQGPWGRGKSTFMGFLKSELVYWTGGDSKSRQELQDLNAQVAHHGPEHPAGRYEAERQRKRTWERMERRSHRDLVLVEVNAWRAEDSSQMWAMVAAAVARKMEQVLPWRSRVHARLRYAWRTHRSAILTQVLVPMAAAALCLGALAILIPGLTLSQDEIKELEAPIKLLVLAIPGLGATAFGWYLAAHSARVTKPVAEQMLSYLRMPEYQSEMGYQHRIIEDLRFMSECMQRAHPRRILVFIDDLDRCSEDKVVRMLQAIQLVLGASQFFVVIGFDARMVHRAIRLHYGNESALPEQFAEHFLRKIVHLSLTLPAAKPDERFKFVRHMFTPAARGDGEKEPDPEETGLGTRATFALPLGFDLEGLRPPVIAEYHAVRETAAELAIYERFQDCLGENPRDLKRLVNIHRLSKILLQRTSTDWPRERQEKLAAWLILCMACPNVVEPLLEMRAQRKPGTDCIEELLKGEAYASPQLQSFNLSRGTLRFIPSDLALGGDLHQAAMIMSAAVE